MKILFGVRYLWHQLDLLFTFGLYLPQEFFLIVIFILYDSNK